MPLLIQANIEKCECFINKSLSQSKVFNHPGMKTTMGMQFLDFYSLYASLNCDHFDSDDKLLFKNHKLKMLLESIRKILPCVFQNFS